MTDEGRSYLEGDTALLLSKVSSATHVHITVMIPYDDKGCRLSPLTFLNTSVWRNGLCGLGHLNHNHEEQSLDLSSQATNWASGQCLQPHI